MIRCSFLFLMVCVGAWCEQVVTPAEQTEVLTLLAEADAVRRVAADERQAWIAERQRIEQIIAAMQAQQQQAEAKSQQYEQALVQLESDMKSADTTLVEQKQQHQVIAAKWLDQYHDIRAQFTQVLPPILLQPIEAGLPADVQDAAASVRILQALALLQDMLAGQEQLVLPLSVKGEEQAVSLLRIGPLLWWRSLDGAHSGTASIDKGILRGRIAEKISEQRAIHQAFHIAQGLEVPQVVVLPYESVAP